MIRIFVILILFIFCYLPFYSFCQKVIIAERYEISDFDSFNGSIKKAISMAKSKALRKAGISENIQNYTSLLIAETKDDFSELFRDELLISINGTVKEWKHISPPQKGYDPETDHFYIDLNIEAKVMKYKTKPDPSFVAKIEGLKSSYISGDENPIDLKIKPYQNCYLKVFYISDEEAQLLYPIETKTGESKPREFENKELVSNQAFGINYLYPETKKQTEFGKLIIVITKESIPYTKAKLDAQGFYTSTTVEDIFEWILTIEPENRKEYYEQFVITK